MSLEAEEEQGMESAREDEDHDDGDDEPDGTSGGVGKPPKRESPFREADIDTIEYRAFISLFQY